MLLEEKQACLDFQKIRRLIQRFARSSVWFYNPSREPAQGKTDRPSDAKQKLHFERQDRYFRRPRRRRRLCLRVHTSLNGPAYY